MPGSDSPRNLSQDTYESLMTLLEQLGVFPMDARVDWSADEDVALVFLGRVTTPEARLLNRALRVAVEQRRPPGILADRPHRPLVGETVLDRATGRTGEFKGCRLRPLGDGEPWTADPDAIRRPDRDALIKARTAGFDAGGQG
ncbi:hypothetical protein AB0D49_17415 [Streptomyces sp. NPDC048290]|uniref:hypothetical protein n=1 Tax=Streptomyces sp. NPDC048290 TaxID=3155811 RepID=UPI00343B2CBA